MSRKRLGRRVPNTTETEEVLEVNVVTDTIRNGVDTEKLFATLDLIKAQPELAKFQFRATNRWISGTHNRSTIRGFYGAGQEDTTRTEDFVYDDILRGGEHAPRGGFCTTPVPRKAHRAQALTLASTSPSTAGS